jgi:hypothetical protein
VACIQNLGAEDGVRERKGSTLGSFTHLLRACERDFVGVPYMFLLIVVGEEDPIGFSWLLFWYLPHVVDIVAGGCRCCPILGL